MQAYPLENIDPWRLAATGASLESVVALDRMSRLTSLLNSSKGQVEFRLRAGVDQQGIHFIEGHGETRVETICQRCMEPMSLPLVVEFRLGLVHSHREAIDLPDEYEPLVVPQDGVSAPDLLEDELILALPLIPKHNHIAQCQANGFLLPETVTPPEKTKPFAELATLLKDSKTRSD